MINSKRQELFENFIFDSSFKLGYDNIKSLNIELLHPKGGLEITIDSVFYLKFYITKKLGSGANGTVYKLYCNTYKIVLALKVEKIQSNVEPLEKNITDSLIKKSCKTLKSKYIGQFEIIGKMSNCYLMELADGDLSYLKSVYKNDSDIKTLIFFRNIIEEIRLQLVCLLNKDIKNIYVYTDVKLENILYRYITEKNTIRIFLGDLGSAVGDNNEYYIASYPPFEYKNNKGCFKLITLEEKKSTLSWMIGILLLLFIDNDNNNSYYFYTKIQKLSEEKHDIIVKKYISDKYGKQFSDYLNINPKNRPDIENQLPVPK
jgi:hypothetical protein